MNTTVKSLQVLYVKLGGSLSDTYAGIADGVAVSDYVNIPDCIAAIKQVAGSGSALPAVANSDKGKILSVNNSGEWAAEMPSVVNVKGMVTSVLEGDEYTPETYYVTMEGEETAGAHYNEIIQLAKAGILVLFSISIYVKDGQLDPTGTGTLDSVMRFYPYSKNNAEWRTIDNTLKLTGNEHLWGITAPEN